MAEGSSGFLARWFVVLAVLVAGPQCAPADDREGGDRSCEQIGYSSGVERIGVMRSTSGGQTWTFVGYACLHRPDLLPVDPAPTEENGKIVLYFLDLNTLDGPSTQAKVIYRAESQDGLDFTEPTPAFSTTQWMITDPCVIRLPGGAFYRMYLSVGSTTVSALSSDGISFDQEGGYRSTTGGVPGAVVLPDNRIRLFVCGNGISSLTSENGIDFIEDPGTRLTPTGGSTLCDPHPIRQRDGTYLMTYKSRPPGASGPQNDQVYLARSGDALTWEPGAEAIVTGSVPSIVERADGTLLIYYIDFSN